VSLCLQLAAAVVVQIMAVAMVAAVVLLRHVHLLGLLLETHTP
jgi:hypothetical protein